MGGHAYIIPGKVEARLLPDPGAAPAEVPRVSFWRRLFGGAPSARPEASRVISLPNGDRHFEIQPARLERALTQSLRNWVRGRLPNPSRASATILEYLSEIEPSVYVRGVQQAGQERPEFYVQVSFSGCAGEAETSARAAAHWAALWYEANHRQIAAEYLVPFGFTPEIKLSKDVEKRLVASIKRYFAENMEVEIGDLKAGLLLDYCLREIGPSIYNEAIADAQAHLQERVSELDSSCYRPEFGYWKD